MKARTVAGKGEKSLLCGPGSELSLRREKEKVDMRRQHQVDGMRKRRSEIIVTGACPISYRHVTTGVMIAVMITTIGQHERYNGMT